MHSSVGCGGGKDAMAGSALQRELDRLTQRLRVIEVFLQESGLLKHEEHVYGDWDDHGTRTCRTPCCPVAERCEHPTLWRSRFGDCDRCGMKNV